MTILRLLENTPHVGKAHVRLQKGSGISAVMPRKMVLLCMSAVLGLPICADALPAASPDGIAWETATIQAQIDATATNGGGRVTVTKGVHPIRTLYLKSGVELHLEKGAILMGGSRSNDYDDAMPLDQTSTYSSEIPATAARKVLLFAEDVENIAITGKGMIDMQGPMFFDHSTKLWGAWWAKPPVPRPRMIVFLRCRNICLEGVTFKDCPAWTMWLRHCEDITVSRIRIETEQRMINSDGIDFDGCRCVRVGDSYFKTGDDCVALRAIRDEQSKDVPVVTEDVIVSNCCFSTPCQGVRIGCPSDDTIRNVVFKNIQFRGNNAIGSQQPRVYLTSGDKGYLKTVNIIFENWTIESDGHPLQMFVEDKIVLRDFGHMTFRNFTVKSKKPFMIKGNVRSPITDIRFENIKGGIAGEPFDVAHAMIDFGHINVAFCK